MKELSLLDALKSRSPYAWLRERDIDLLVCAEFHARAALSGHLANLLGYPSARLTGAWVSHAEIDGESDLVAAYDIGSGVVIALIENKIAASFQPDQAARYLQRARRWSQAEGVAAVRTVLLAPARYMDRPGSEIFNLRLTYEDAATCLRAETDGRSNFLADTLQAGVDAYLSGYVAVPNAAVSDTWQACWNISQSIAPKLNFQRPGLKPGESTWFYFREAEGFDGIDWRQAVVVYKTERGQVDLQFGGRSEADLKLMTAGLLGPSMSVVKAGKSASIRVVVPKIDFHAPPDSQIAKAQEGFAACEKLREFFCRHRARLSP